MNARTTRSQDPTPLYQSACEFQRGFSRAANRFLCAALLLAALAGGFAPRAEAAVSATGGTVTNFLDTNGVVWVVHVFTNAGTTNLAVSGSGDVDVLVVAGGGSGGGSYYHGGGGGAGGLIFSNVYPVAPGSYEVRVGKGGDALIAGSSAQGNNGSNSWFSSLVAYGGGGGGRQSGCPK